MENETKAPYSGDRFELFNLDILEFLRTRQNDSVDLIITDPPYESLEKWRNIGTKARLKKNWFPIVPNSLFPKIFEEFYRILKRNSHFYLFCDHESLFIFKPMMEQVGFKFWRPLVWDKKKIGMGYHYRARYEFIMFAEKGKRHLNGHSISDVLEVPRINNGYPTEKPVAVADILISQSAKAGDIVMDPFCGAGFVGVAALKYACSFIGNDVQQTALDITKKRLVQLQTNCEQNIAPQDLSSKSIKQFKQLTLT